MKLLVSVLTDLFQRYRPEAHYMRGPGPACAAKRRSGTSASAPADRGAPSRRVDTGDAPAQ